MLNIHTHRLIGEKNIYNFIIPHEEETLQEGTTYQIPSTWFSAGIHPWYINEQHLDQQFYLLRQIAALPQVKFVGECGLDRLKGVDLATQEKVFIQQIRIAEELKKPLIIHRVKCFGELISIEKIIRPKTALIVHGFNNNEQIAQQLLKNGFYLSFGAAILKEDSNAQAVLRNTPIEQIFLETDETEISIEEIYAKAAEIKHLKIELLEEAVYDNFLTL